MLTKIGTKSKTVCDQIRRRIAESTVVGADETGLYVNSALNWAWIFQTDQLTYVYQDKSRGMKAINNHFRSSDRRARAKLPDIVENDTKHARVDAVFGVGHHATGQPQVKIIRK